MTLDSFLYLNWADPMLLNQCPDSLKVESHCGCSHSNFFFFVKEDFRNGQSELQAVERPANQVYQVLG